MSLVLVIDGYNVVSPIAPPKRSSDGNWLQAERTLLIDRLIKHLPSHICDRTCLVFDAANPPRDRPSDYHVQGLNVRFAVGYPQADDLIEEIIAQHSSPKRLTVVSSDHRIQNSAKRRGATSFDSDIWLDQLMDGQVKLAISVQPPGQGRADENRKPDIQVSDKEVDDWMQEFGFDD